MEAWPESLTRRSSGGYRGPRKIGFGTKQGNSQRDETHTQEFTLKGRLILVLLPVSAVAFAQQPVPEIAMISVPDFLKPPPDLYLGEAAGVAVNSNGNIFVLSRANTTASRLGRNGSATARVWPGRQVHPRARQEPLRFRLSLTPSASIRTTISGQSTKVRT